MHQRLILLALAALVPLAMLAAGLAFANLRQEQERTRAEALARAEALMADVDRELASYLEILSLLTQSPLLDGQEPDLTRFGLLASRLKVELPLWERIILTDRTDRQIFNSGLPAGAPLPAVVDPVGHRRVIETGAPAISDLVGPGPLSRDGKPRASLRAPVARDGEIRYVLTALVSLQRLTAIMEAADLPAAWRPFLVDGAGRLAAAPAAPDRVGETAGAMAIAARDEGDEGVYAGETPAGDPVVTAFRQSEATGWSTHVAIPLGVYNAPLRRSGAMIGVAVATALALTALFALLFRRELQARRRDALARERAARLEALGRVAGGVAHDVNNVLQVILSGIALIRRRHPDPGVERFLDAMKDVAERGAQTTQGLLGFSRGGAARRTRLDLGAHIRRMQPLLRQALRGDIALEVEAPDAPLVAEVDATQLDLALLNLLSNARDAMPGGGTVRVALAAAAGPGGAREARLTVSDDGAGIPEDALARAFEPFFTTKPVGRGTGLGLAQVYGFARQSGGSAEISSRVGVGTTVELRVPLLDAAAAAPAPAATAQRPAPPDAGRPRRLLIVDDNDAVRSSTAAFLEECGYFVSKAASAEEALAQIEAAQDETEVVVSDLVMPGAMNGLALAETIRARHPKVAVVLMTGYSDAAADAASAGFPLIPKPVDFDALLAAIAEAPTRRAGP